MKRKRKSYLIPTLYLLFLFSVTVGIYFTKKAYDKYTNTVDMENITFVTNTILNRTIPIINTVEKINNPYSQENMKIARYYYNASDNEEQKAKSIVFYADTYMPNTGIDYYLEETFDVLSIYDGTVIDVSEDELLGKTVKVRHNGEVISVYQSLGEVDVSRGDVILSGQKIGTSGKNNIDKELGNHLHLEIYKSGETIDPLKCIGKKLGDI